MQHRKDKNEKPIVDELRYVYKLAVFVSSHVGKGFCDIIIPYNNHNWFIEIKFDKNSKLTPAQRKFHKWWKQNGGQIDVALTTQQILKIIGYKDARNSAKIDNKIQSVDSTKTPKLSMDNSSSR